jgi:hypothetical protein
LPIATYLMKFIAGLARSMVSANLSGLVRIEAAHFASLRSV